MNTAQAMGLAAMLLAALAARGREVYVDYEGGSDDADGLTPQTPFKHCPGDAAAAGKAKALALAAGDRAIFKGGVEYRSVVTIPWSGAEGQPIVYDGNTAGGFGTGMAIVQCGEPVGGWKKVASADEVRGHPNWERLYVTTLDKARGFFTFSLYEGATYLNCAQDPDPEIPFFHDRLKNYRNTKTATGSSVTDAAYFTQSDARFFDGAYVSLHVKPNVLTYRAVSGYEPGTHTLSFKPHGKETYGGARGHNYSILNCIHFLNRPGEYWLDERPDGVRLVLWPHRPGAGGPEGVTISERKNGFVLQDASHVTIEGFRILQFGGNRAAAIAKSGGLSRGLVIRGNEIARGRTYPSRSGAILLGDVEHSLIEANHIHENAYCAGLMLSRFNDSTARRNLLVRNGSTAVDYYDCHRSTLLHNVVRDNLGMHANGLTLYLGCSEILVEGNEVYGSNVGLTMQDGKDITVRNNIFDGNGGLCIGLWSGKPAGQRRHRQQRALRRRAGLAGGDLRREQGRLGLHDPEQHPRRGLGDLPRRHAVGPQPLDAPRAELPRREGRRPLRGRPGPDLQRARSGRLPAQAGQPRSGRWRET
ncbi:MAG: right-handed parallel beta-helix repeat-containing protein [Planctomycetota bacterium]|nr:right-handed parallel beta-helix repeat-containing protein [Planctomycetota bacterium]